MDELINYNGYEEFKQVVNRVLNRIGRGLCPHPLSAETGKRYRHSARIPDMQRKRICLERIQTGRLSGIEIYKNQR